MKHAMVLDHHHGDDGTVSEGMILKDVSAKRFDELEKAGLVREATTAEVEAGYQPPFECHDVGAAGGEASEGGEGATGSGTKVALRPANKRAPAPANKAS